MVYTLKKDEWFRADGFPIAVALSRHEKPYGLHDHEFSELVIVTGGEGQHVYGENSWQLCAGDVFVIDRSRPHGYVDVDNLQLTNVLFDKKRLSSELMDLSSLAGYHVLFHLEPFWRKRHEFQSRLHLSPTDVGTAVGIVRELEEELHERNVGFGFLATASFMQLVGFLSRCCSFSENANSQVLLRIAKAITHLQTHYTEEVNLNELVEMAQIPKRSFQRAFEAAVGCTPIAYVIRLRITRAAKLLRQTDDPIADIACEVGFNSNSYFARQFRKHFGISPRTYRNNRAS